MLSAEQPNPEQPPRSLRAVVDQYREMDAISHVIDSRRGHLDPDETRDVVRDDYQERISCLIRSLSELPSSDVDWRAALGHTTGVFAEDELAPWRDQDTETLYERWYHNRGAINRGLAQIADVELLADVVAKRDQTIVDLEIQVDNLGEQIGELEAQIGDRDQRLEARTVVLADLAGENITLRNNLAECERRTTRIDQIETPITQVDDEEELEMEES